MTDFLRPEARAAVNRWREAVFGLCVVLLSLQFAWSSSGGRRGLAYAVALVGLAIMVEGIRRARLPRDGGGAGVVEIDERQITYFGPDGGGAISVEGLVRIEARSTGKGRFLWVFLDGQGLSLAIPSTAEGAAQIFDALSALKGFDYEDVIETASLDTKAVRVLWEKDAPRLG